MSTHPVFAKADDKVTFGFWVYLMTDCLLFASFFATYAVLHNHTFGGPSGQTLFNMPTVLAETLILLTSSFTCGLAMLAAHRNSKNQVIGWLMVTLVLGLTFLTLEMREFSKLIADGHGPQQSAFLTSFFSLVGLHGLHIAVGSLIIIVFSIELWVRGMTSKVLTKLTCLSLFWHFLDIVWIFIFTLVYLMGVRV